MSKKLFHGSCHCGKVKFQANLDLTQETVKCNCTFCRKYSWWQTKIDRKGFELLEGKDSINEYSNDRSIGFFAFCKNCGTFVFADSNKTEWTEDAICVTLGCLDDVNIKELSQAPVSYYNSKDDSYSSITDPEEIKTMY
jgi:hypothetical protein